MSRDVPFDKDAVCDGCGAMGAFDFMGDFFCPKCLAEDKDAAQPTLAGDGATCPRCRGVLNNDGYCLACGYPFPPRA